MKGLYVCASFYLEVKLPVKWYNVKKKKKNKDLQYYTPLNILQFFYFNFYSYFLYYSDYRIKELVKSNITFNSFGELFGRRRREREGVLVFEVF
jgi:hypothetical protein